MTITYLDLDTNEQVSNEDTIKIELFLKELEQLESKFKLVLTHEDSQGAFIYEFENGKSYL